MSGEGRPLVSVCVPAYNMGRFLGDCIESVLAQTYPAWELIICDDRSTDGTAEVCRAYAGRDARLRYVRNERRLGMFENFRRTAELAEGEFLKFLCADDWLHPECLEECLRLMTRHPTAVLVSAGCIDVDGEGRQISGARDYVLPKRFYRGSELIRRQMWGLPAIGGNSSFIVRRSAYEAVGGYDVSYRYAADNHLALRLCQAGDFVSTDRVLFFGRHHGAQSSHRSDEDFTPVRDWIEIPRSILAAGRRWSPSWWLLRMAVGRVVADNILVGLFRIFRGRGRTGIRLIGFVVRAGRPWWPALLLAPVRIPILAFRGLTRRFRILPPAPIWHPVVTEETASEKRS